MKKTVRYLLLSIALTSITLISSCAHQSQEALTLEKEKQSQINEGMGNPAEQKKLCDDKDIAKSCFRYALYHQHKSKDYKEAYEYHKRAFDLGIKQAGFYVAHFQIHKKQIFTENTQPNIDESIYYLEQAVEVNYPYASNLLMTIYRLPDFNRIDYKKAEYYNKLAVEQKIPQSRGLLVSLYIYDLKDTTKTELSIKLLNEELFEERTAFSAQGLATIYTAMKPNKIKALAYFYVSKELYLSTDSHSESARKLYELVELAEKEMTTEQIQEAKVLYKEIKAEMDTYAENNKSA